ncbi:MAG TPA: HesA/MoeB/ThiF family protein [Polyangia bacterium]|jgi:adenylyltransferase/sulfurtransferase
MSSVGSTPARVQPAATGSSEALARGGVLVIGAGGLGCAALFALASAGVRRIGVIDDDRVDASNIHRQLFHATTAVGELKVESLAQALASRFPAVKLEAHAARFEPTTAALVERYDVIVDGSDNFATKFLANDAAVLAGKPLVHGAAVGLGGQLLTVPAGGHPCYRCLFEEIPPPGVGPSCAEAGVLGPVPGVIGALQGAEAVRLLAGETPRFSGRLIQYDSASMSFRTIRFKPNHACGVCGPTPHIRLLDPAAYPAPSCL